MSRTTDRRSAALRRLERKRLQTEAQYIAGLERARAIIDALQPYWPVDEFPRRDVAVRLPADAPRTVPAAVGELLSSIALLTAMLPGGVIQDDEPPPSPKRRGAGRWSPTLVKGGR